VNTTIEEKAQNVAFGLGITVWITQDGRIVQSRPPGGIEVKPDPKAKPTPHGSPAEIKPIGEAA
jgi:hypothetical protein